MEFSKDGSLLFSTGRANVMLWDTAAGRRVLAIDALNNMEALALSPDGRSLATGGPVTFSGESAVRLFDLKEGRGLQLLLGLSHQIQKMGFSRDGRWVAAFSQDWQAGVWDARTGSLRFLFQMPPGPFPDNATMAFDAESRRFAFSGHEHATLWDLQTGRLLRTWKLPPSLSNQLSFHGSDRLTLFRMETRDRVGPFSNNRPKDHPRVYRFYNLLGPSPVTPIKEIDDHDWHCFGSVIPADGRIILAEGISRKSGRSIRTLNSYNGISGELLWSMPASQTNTGNFLVWLDPTGTLLLLSNGKEGRLTGLRLPGREWIADLHMDGIIPHLAPGGRRWFAGYGDRASATYRWNYYPEGSDGPIVPFLGVNESAGTVVFGQDGRHVAWGNPDHSLSLCDLTEVQRAMAEFGLGW
jgi:WD40 repeat protein